MKSLIGTVGILSLVAINLGAVVALSVLGVSCVICSINDNHKG